MTARTAEASTVQKPLGRPGGPGLFGVKGLHLPAYVQHVAHRLVGQGHPKSQAIQMAIGIIKDWAAGRRGASPEVQAAAQKAVAQWEAAKAKAHSMSNQTEAIELATKEEQRPTGENRPERKADGTYQLPPGAVGWKHGWIPVDSNGNPVARTKGTQDAIAQAHRNRAEADAKKTATAQKAAAKKAFAETARKSKKDQADQKRNSLAAQRKAEKDLNDAVRLAEKDEKAGRQLNDHQKALLAAARTKQAAREKDLRGGKDPGAVTNPPKKAKAKKADDPSVIGESIYHGPTIRFEDGSVRKDGDRILSKKQLQEKIKRVDAARAKKEKATRLANLAERAIELAAPGSRGNIYRHGWVLKSGLTADPAGKKRTAVSKVRDANVTRGSAGAKTGVVPRMLGESGGEKFGSGSNPMAVLRDRTAPQKTQRPSEQNHPKKMSKAEATDSLNRAMAESKRRQETAEREGRPLEELDAARKASARANKSGSAADHEAAAAAYRRAAAMESDSDAMKDHLARAAAHKKLAKAANSK